MTVGELALTLTNFNTRESVCYTLPGHNRTDPSSMGGGELAKGTQES